MEKNKEDIKVYNSFKDYFYEKDKNNLISSDDKVCKNCAHYEHNRNRYPVGICRLKQYSNQNFRIYKVNDPYRSTCSKFQPIKKNERSHINVVVSSSRTRNSELERELESIKSYSILSEEQINELERELESIKSYSMLSEGKIKELARELYDECKGSCITRQFFDKTNTGHKLDKMCREQSFSYDREVGRVMYQYSEYVKYRINIILCLISLIVIILSFIFTIGVYGSTIIRGYNIILLMK